MASAPPAADISRENSQAVSEAERDNTAESHEQLSPSVEHKNRKSGFDSTGMSALVREMEALRKKVQDLEHKTEENMQLYPRSSDSEATDSDSEKFSDSDGPQTDMDRQQLYKIRRKVAREIDYKSRSIVRWRKRKEQEQKHLIALDNKATTTPTPKTVSEHDAALVPKLNKVDWANFKPAQPAPREFVIDVLVGEPHIVWEHPSSVRSGTAKKHTPGIDQTSNKPQVQSNIPGKQPLPERIRINSRLLLLIIAKINGSEDIFGDSESVVMVRPFVMLDFLREEIRESYASLLTKHGVTMADQIPTNEEVPIGFLSETATRTSAAEKSGDKMYEKPESEKSDEVQSGVTANHLESKLALMHMKPLIEFLEEYILAKHAYLGSPQCQGITYHDLWFLLKPGDEVISPEENQAYRIFSVKIPTHKAVSPWASYERQGKVSTLPPPPEEEQVMSFFFELVSINFDGMNLSPIKHPNYVIPFEGERLVTELRYYPLRFHPALLNGAQRAHSPLKETGNLLRLQLIERGRKYTQMTSFQHAYHSGTAVGGNEALDGQVVVDITRASRERQAPPPMLKNWLRERNTSSPTDRISFLCGAECCRDELVWSERGTQRRRNDEFLDRFIPQNPNDPLSVSVASSYVEYMRKTAGRFRFSDEELVIMDNTVEGFVLRTRKWAYMKLDNLSEIDYRSGEAKSEKEDEVKDNSKTAFDNLVLPEGHKEMILSLVAQHFRDQGKHEEVDIVRGKGKGLIMLLHGAPGVGKTSTAEGVAELFKKPLLQITCGDLGSTAKEVEIALEKNFSLASRWDAILLLDEADVFLASRSRATSGTDFNRNALVAVFLRVLEYYTGILFLTTNRVGDFDEAFASRIHVSLEYPPLDRKSTKKVLALNLRLIEERFKKSKRLISIDEQDISIDAEDYWSTNDKARLNGRQIRNACHTALALAEFEAQGGNHKTILAPNAKVTLTSKHFSTVFKAYLDFNKYLKDVYGTWSEDRAKEFELRAGEKVPSGSNDLQSRRNLESSQTGSFPGQRFYQ